MADRDFGNNSENTVGKSLMQLINQGKMLHIGPHFPTYISHGAATNTDKILANKHHYLNINTEPGGITSSDHIPIIFTLATQPFVIPQPKVYGLNKANWDAFQEVLESKIQVKELDDCSTEETETEVKNSTDTVKEAMEKYIPKREHKFVYQLRTTEIQLLELSYKRLKQNADSYGWTWDNFNEYLRINVKRHGTKIGKTI